MRETGRPEPGVVSPARRLSLLAEQAARTAPSACGAGATVREETPASEGAERPAAVTHPDLAALVSVQIRTGQGPIPAAEELGRPVASGDLLNEERWSAYRAVALDSGVRTCVALPFRKPGLTLTISLYSFRPDGLTARERTSVEVLGGLAADAVACDRERLAALAEVDQLGTALRSRSQVDQACGIVMHVLDCGPDDAFGVLRRVSQGTDRKLSDVASALVGTRGSGMEQDIASLAPSLRDDV